MIKIKFFSGNEFTIDEPSEFDKKAFLELIERGKKINAPFEFPGVETKTANETFGGIRSIDFD